MKRFAAFLLLLVSALAGAARWLDVVNYTDLDTGFVTWGPTWARYAIAGGILVLLALGALLAPRRPAALCGQSTAQGVMCFLTGFGFAALGGTKLAGWAGLDAFGKAGAVPVIHEEENYSFEIGKAEVLRPGTDVAVAATGLMVAEALKAAETLAAEGINVRVINVCSIKPLDEETILAAARECGKIVTCEEHSIIGGLGEAVCSLVSEKHPVPVRRVGVNDEFGHSGPAAALLEEMGLCASHIAEVVRETVKG